MAPTSLKRELPQAASTRPHQIRRIAPTLSVPTAELWETICKAEPQTLREIVFHATMADIDPQVSLRVLNMHHVRVHNESAAAEQARRNQELSDQRARKKIHDFDHHFRQIDFWVSTDPFEQKVYRTSYNKYEKIVARIGKIEEKATEATTNFQSKCNALQTLRMVVDCVLRNEGGAMGCAIFSYMDTDREVEDAMMRILRSMTLAERDELLYITYDDILWTDLMLELDAFRKTKVIHSGDFAGTSPFPGISDVLNFVFGPQPVRSVEDHVQIKEESHVRVKEQAREECHVRVKEEAREG